jgi:hypothetical protein
MRVRSGDTARKMFFIAVDPTDKVTRETGLTTFTVYRSRDGGTATQMTTPTVAEVDATNMPGVYVLTLDEDMDISDGAAEEEMCFHITQASMEPVTRTIELFRDHIVWFQAQTGTLSTSETTTDLTGFTVDQLINRVMIPLSGAAAGEAVQITDYTVSGGKLEHTGLLTVNMANNDWGIIV